MKKDEMMPQNRVVSAAAIVLAVFGILTSSHALAGEVTAMEEAMSYLHPAPRGSTHVTATVVDADGAPVEGAVVVTSEGGQGISDSDGIARFAVEPDSRLAGQMHVTAVAVIEGVNHAGSVPIRWSQSRGAQDKIDAGLITVSADAECMPEWIPRFGSDGTMQGAIIFDLTVFDDGSGNGPALIAVGSLSNAGGVAVNNIAQWNGMYWSSLGGGVNSFVYAITVFDDGSGGGQALYVGGMFTMAGSVQANRIARWDGSEWSALGSGIDGSQIPGVLSLTAFDDGNGSGPALYVGGNFAQAGGIQVNGLARWDGQEWSAVGDWPGGGARQLVVFDDGSGPALYAGGLFTSAGGNPVNRIAKWDGASWSPLGSGVSGGPSVPGVWALAVFADGSMAGEALFAGGHFDTAGGVPAVGVAKWNGSSWSPLGTCGNLASTGVPQIHSLLGDSESSFALYVGGQFTTAGGETANRITAWQGCPSRGACCVNGVAVQLTANECSALGGVFYGSWVPSGEVMCDAPCIADLNADGVVDVSDLLQLLGSWGLCP
jgi:hypothetical protein